MPLLKIINGKLAPAVEEALTEVTLDAWRANPQAHSDASALVVENDEKFDDVANDIAQFGVVILQFPQFKDGRAYSQARLLRERYGYQGEIRARGNVLRDQLLFMTRCGVTGFELASGDAAAGSQALGEFSFAYQPAADAAEPIWRRRIARVRAA